MLAAYKFLTNTIAPVPRPTASPKPSMSKYEWTAYWVIFIAGFGFALWISLASSGYSLDDEITHYLRSHQAWTHPERLLDNWTRPGRNFIHFFFAWMPLEAVRVATLLMACGVGWIATKLAASYNLKHLWLLPLFIWFEPWYLSLSGAVLTQTPFALFAILGIYWLTRGHDFASGFCWGYLSLIRHEGFAFSLMFFVWFAVHGRWKGILGVIAPIAIYNLISAIAIGAVPLAIFFEPKPTVIYGSGSLFHFVLPTLWFAGPMIVLLSLLGLPRLVRDWKFTWPLVIYPLYWLMHTIIFWRGMFASGGYFEFLMPMAPGFGIAALYGVQFLRTMAQDQPAIWRSACAGILLAVLLPPIVTTRPFVRDTMKSDLDTAMRWVAENRSSAPIVLCANIYVEYKNELWRQPGYDTLHYTDPREQAMGTIIVWDYKYADVTFFLKDELEPAGSGWTRLTSFGKQAALAKNPGEETVVIYERTGSCTLPKVERSDLLRQQ